jgi:hypothetical protein
VQRARHQLLAGAALAGDQHRDLALAEPADGAEHVLHGRRLAQHLGGQGLRACAPRGVLALAFLHGAADQLHRLGQVEGLGQVLEGAALEGRDGAVEVGEGRHDDDRQAGQLGLDLGQQVQTAAAGHADVADQHLRRASSASAASTSRGLVKLRTGKPSRASAFSSTKRMDWSSSTIQIGFMGGSGTGGGSAGSWQGISQAEVGPPGCCRIRSCPGGLHEGLRQRQPQPRAAFAPDTSG